MLKNDSVTELLRQKVIIMNEFLSITQQELLMVDLERLSPLLERKDGLISEIRLIDEALGLHDGDPPDSEPMRVELAELVEAVLENERALEERLLEEQSRLRQEIRGLDQESQLKQYLKKSTDKGGTVNLKH
ncbi:MAG: flagellar protein FliT [SAR324 cluster bacterium]|nr:flagellar protein FliT [SAR324 cluster bacterium]MCH8885931.1 flagellar protein FliT [SAR324 cluster bacterium]